MTTVRVEAPARLHMGMLDAAGAGPRRFGGLGRYRRLGLGRLRRVGGRSGARAPERRRLGGIRRGLAVSGPPLGLLERLAALLGGTVEGAADALAERLTALRAGPAPRLALLATALTLDRAGVVAEERIDGRLRLALVAHLRASRAVSQVSSRCAAASESSAARDPPRREAAASFVVSRSS